MKLRGPSLGFVYLCLAVAGCVLFFVWLRQPMWWSLQERHDREIAEAKYLIRIAAKGPEKRRAAWLGSALRLSVANAEWDLAQQVAESMLQQELALPKAVANELRAGEVWLLGADSERWAKASTPMMLLVKNGADSPAKLSLSCATKRATKVHVQQPGEAQRAVEAAAGTTVVECTVAASTTSWIVLHADEASFKPRESGARGLQLMKVEGGL